MREVPRAAQIKKAILDYARRTWSVYAVLPGDAPKGQAIGPANATTNLSQIDQWLQQWPTMGVGLATGVRHGFVAVVTEGEAGVAALKALADRHKGLPSTPYFDDAGGKRVWLFKPPRRQSTCISRQVAPHIALVGDGDGVALPCDPDDNPVWCVTPNHVSIAELPAWLLVPLDQGDGATRKPASATTTSPNAQGASVQPLVVSEKNVEVVASVAETTPALEVDGVVSPATTAAHDHGDPLVEPGTDAETTPAVEIDGGVLPSPTAAAEDCEDQQAEPATDAGTSATVEVDGGVTPSTTAADDHGDVPVEPASVPIGLQVVAVDAIRVGNRHRHDMGDLDSLASSIAHVGLLHVPVVTADLRLIAGARRLAAVRRLGWTEMPVVIVHDLNDATRALQAERDENSCRQPLSPSEAVALARALEALERPRAQERQRQHGGTAPGRPKNTRGNLPRVSPEPKTRELVAASVGFSGRTLDMAKAVEDAANAEPERFANVRATMNRTGNVHAAYQEVRGNRRKAKADAHAAAGVRSAGLRDRGADADTLIVQRPATDGQVTELAERLVKFLGPTGCKTLVAALTRHLAKPGVKKSPRPRTKTKPGRKRSTRLRLATKPTSRPGATKRLPEAVEQAAIDLFD